MDDLEDPATIQSHRHQDKPKQPPSLNDRFFWAHFRHQQKLNAPEESISRGRTPFFKASEAERRMIKAEKE